MTALTIIPPALLGRTAFDQIFDSFFQDPFPMIKRSTEGYPLTDIYVDGEGSQVIEIALAGFSKEELAAEVMDNKVTIRAAAQLSEDDPNNQGLQRRIAQRAFSRTFVDYNNQLGFGADINVLAASDTNYFADISSVKPDTLVRSLFLENNTDSKDSLILTEKQMELFKDSIYIKINVNIFGDEIFFLSTDSLILKLSASMDYLINAPDSTGTPDE